MRTLRLEIFWKVKSIKRWWSHQSYADRLFLYMNSLFVFCIGVVPLLCWLLGVQL